MKKTTSKISYYSPYVGEENAQKWRRKWPGTKQKIGCGMLIKKQFFINSCKKVSDSGDQNFKENLMLESFNKVVDNMSFKKCNLKAIWSYNE